ncbi:ZC3H14 family protein [Megaselia abdita]
MEDLSSEISQKMRSAVKAKLMELGGNTYIDDELPDYVMIMVANKRSRQQMITDLTLFLDSQTELFVTWLHEVLTKLQAVTEQPAALTPSKKKKETKKKEKKKIADVVAEDCIIKSTNQHVEVESTKKEERSDTPPLPTITEMVVHHQKQKAVESNQKQKELVEIQKKIIETKKKIQEMDETEEPVEMEQAPKPVKKSIAERIGTKEPKRRNKREDRELYVPTNRRSDIHHDRKIGSRVIKAPPKVEVASDGEEHDKTVCSIIKVKPRPKLSPTRQPSKNLLLKAMADAQKSAVQATKDSLKRRLKSRSPSPLIKSMRGQKLYTKSYRNRMNRDAIIRRHIGKTKDNIVVHVKGSGTKEEYIPEPVSDKNDESDNDYVYIPQQIESKEGSMESLENVDYDMEKKPETTATQFVVTLDGVLSTELSNLSILFPTGSATVTKLTYSPSSHTWP